MLKKILPRSGVNKENTRYTTEGGWYDCDKVRFRQGTPETIGGWQPISTTAFLGTCRSLWNWTTNAGNQYNSLGTNLKFYLNLGSGFYDITPIRSVASLSAALAASNGSSVITVTHTSHGAKNGDYVTFYNASSLGGNITATVLNAQHQITYISANSYSITVSAIANGSDTGTGGTFTALYQLNTGLANNIPLVGWGAGAWASGSWGTGQSSTQQITLYSQSNFGQDLIFSPRGGGIYYWYHQYSNQDTNITMTIATPCVVTGVSAFSEGMPIRLVSTGSLPTGLSIGSVYYIRNLSGNTCNLSATPTGALINTSGAQSGTHSIQCRGLNISYLPTASDTPTVCNYMFISDQYRFVFALGTNDYGSTEMSPMLLRWSDQEDAGNWTPSALTQAGSLPLSHGSYIVTAIQNRQEINVFTDSTLYSLQYQGPPYVWGAQIIQDNVSIQSPNAVAVSSGVVYWMGVDKFYKYDGRVQSMRCDLRQYVFGDINHTQTQQVFAGTNEGFNEIWWFYPSASATVNDRYVVYNYMEDIWYHGTITRTAWLDAGTLSVPIAATGNSTLVSHETGTNANETGTDSAINAYITSSEFDIDDGSNFGFVWRILPDLTFRGSTAENPYLTLTLQPLKGSGSGYNSPMSVGGDSSANVIRSATVPVEQFTNQINIRVRGRQLSMKAESNQLGCAWQLGSMRLDIRQDGRK